ncbi:hypothetical protein BGX38DRAFT_1146566 [Terfezia claveryi]|nr:hypothetical protein BGX38DRAFT_1146566 [Terfezia claveryi]
MSAPSSSDSPSPRPSPSIIVSSFRIFSVRVLSEEYVLPEEEQRILDTYEPAPLQESDSDSDDIPSISYKLALGALETLRLFRLQHPHLSLQKREQLEGLLYRESTRHGSKDAASDKYHGVFHAALGHFLVFFVYILI